ncbi:MAG TPA: dihydroneopterin aldolase, partial [Puia sp.]|nr:dihydroneopterin aldolase [Puia sp.]
MRGLFVNHFITAVFHMVTIELKNLILHGYHGIYEEEKKVMNTFEVSLSVKYDENESDFSSMRGTISYVDLHHIVKQKFQVPALLLEKIGQDIIRK